MMSKNEMKANHNNGRRHGSSILVGKYDVKERDESKSQPWFHRVINRNVGKYDVKERDESKSQPLYLPAFRFRVGKYDVKERDESKSQLLCRVILWLMCWQI